MEGDQVLNKRYFQNGKIGSLCDIVYVRYKAQNSCLESEKWICEIEDPAVIYRRVTLGIFLFLEAHVRDEQLSGWKGHYMMMDSMKPIALDADAPSIETKMV